LSVVTAVIAVASALVAAVEETEMEASKHICDLSVRRASTRKSGGVAVGVTGRGDPCRHV
jgi:hypothetical protein